MYNFIDCRMFENDLSIHQKSGFLNVWSKIFSDSPWLQSLTHWCVMMINCKSKCFLECRKWMNFLHLLALISKNNNLDYTPAITCCLIQIKRDGFQDNFGPMKILLPVWLEMSLKAIDIYKNREVKDIHWRNTNCKSIIAIHRSSCLSNVLHNRKLLIFRKNVEKISMLILKMASAIMGKTWIKHVEDTKAIKQVLQWHTMNLPLVSATFLIVGVFSIKLPHHNFHSFLFVHWMIRREFSQNFLVPSTPA